MRFETSGALSMAILAVAGCRPDKVSGAGDPGPTAADRALAEAVCDWVIGCEATAGRIFASRQACLDGILCNLGGERLAVLNESSLGTCLAALGTAPCGVEDLDHMLGRLCGAALGYPQSPPGGSCAAADCVEDAYCVGNGTPGACPVCVALPADGESCAATFRCATGAWCDGVDDMCKPTKTDGDSCANDVECESGVCNTSHLCAAPPPKDASCTSTYECAGYYRCILGVCTELGAEGDLCTSVDACAFGLACVSGVCTAQPVCVAGQAGGACHGFCVDGTYCEEDETTGTGTCKPVIPLGQPCATATGAACGPSAYCDDFADQCTAYIAEGGTCTLFTQYDCADGTVCDFTTDPPYACTAPKAGGGSCFFDEQCASRYCDQVSGACADPATCTL